MRIYLAARYSRRLELCEYREQLRALGHEVTSRWLNGEHRAIDLTASPEERSGFAIEDLEDLYLADMVISFTEPPDNPYSRGGRHVEFGFAIGCDKKLAVVGYQENVFHCLPEVRFCQTWEEFVSSTDKGGWR